MKMFSLLSMFVLLVSTVGVSAATSDPKEEKACAVLETMAKATIAKDVATLDKIYERPTYSHSSALTQTKAEVLKAITGAEHLGVDEVQRYDHSDLRRRGVGQGRLRLPERRAGKMTDNHLNILWVLVKNPVGWQIVARQTTRTQPRKLHIGSGFLGSVRWFSTERTRNCRCGRILIFRPRVARRVIQDHHNNRKPRFCFQEALMDRHMLRGVRSRVAFLSLAVALVLVVLVPLAARRKAPL
jgi:hypothetical protein